VNIIPGRVTFTIDLRSLSDKLRNESYARFQAEAEKIAKARGLTVAFDLFHEVATAYMAPVLQDDLEAGIRDVGGDPIRLPSGAGHDAQIMTRLCPSAMMFVRCRGGISHNPAEFASEADMGLAVAALIRFIERFKA
jgi:allantoate deiminase